MPLYGRALFHPGYIQRYGDIELTLIARQKNALTYHPHSMLVETDHLQDDKALFEKRARQGFDGRVHDNALLASFT